MEVENDSSLTGPQVSYHPMQIPAFNMNPGLILVLYLVHAQPPLAALPLGADKWSASAFTKLAGVSKNGFARAYPDRADDNSSSSHSGRKTFAQLLHDSGCANTIAADSGGWALKRAAVHMYFRTSRWMNLQAVSSLGK